MDADGGFARGGRANNRGSMQHLYKSYNLVHTGGANKVGKDVEAELFKGVAKNRETEDGAFG